MVGSALDGEDIVQDALVRALEAASTEQPIANPDGWLFRIAHNLALDHLRRRARRGDTHNEDDMDSLAHPVDDQSRRDAAAATLSTFMRLPASQRSVVILFDVLEYSAEEVAEILETTVPAMKSILQRGRNRLRMLARNPAEQQARVPLQKSEQQARVPLQKSEQQLLRRYVDLFNARDFDTLRTMLAADVRLDLVNRAKLQGPAVGEYFGQYGIREGWKAWAGIVEGRPAVLMQQQGRADDLPDYFVVLGFADERITTIRDFYFARYALEDAQPQGLERY